MLLISKKYGVAAFFKLKQDDLGQHLENRFLKNQVSQFPEKKAIMRDFIVMKEAIKRIAIKSDYARSDQKRGKTAALVAEEGFEPPTQGL